MSPLDDEFYDDLKTMTIDSAVTAFNTRHAPITPPVTPPVTPPSTATALVRGKSWYEKNTGPDPSASLTLHPTRDLHLTSADSNKTIERLNVPGMIFQDAAVNVKLVDVVCAAVQGKFEATRCRFDGASLGSVDRCFENGIMHNCEILNGYRGVKFDDFLEAYDCYIHDLRSRASDHIHREAILCNGNKNPSKIIRVYCDSGSWTDLSGEICLYGDDRQIHDIEVYGSLLMSSGSFQFYGGSVPGKKFPTAARMKFTNNAIGPWPKSAAPGSKYGPAACWQKGAGNIWSVNTTLDGKLINEPQTPNTNPWPAP